MTKPTDSTTTTEPVSTVTKHITIYSDNPIHDCIDRIINACLFIDEYDDFCGMAAAELYESADELTVLAGNLRKQKSDEFLRSINLARPN
jgi:hypothetical protein